MAALLLLSGCGSEERGAGHGACNARIQFQGTVFRGHDLVNELAPADNPASGTGEVLGCDGKAVGHVAIHKLTGVDPELAIAVIGDKWPGVYVREGTGPSDWPAQLRGSST